MRLCTSLDYPIEMKCQQNLVHCQINTNGPARSGLTNPLHRYLAHGAIARGFMAPFRLPALSLSESRIVGESPINPR